VFIGGTIHVLSAEDYPLPVEFEQAYNQSQTIIFETDLAAMALPDSQQQLLSRVIYAPGKSLADDLTLKTYQTLSDYLLSMGLNVENLKQFKPPMIMITLLMIELQKLGMAETGVDKYFNQKALSEGKGLGELESLQVQLDVIANMGKGFEDEMIMSTIEDMKELPFIMSEMKRAWRAGDTDGLEKLSLLEMKNDYPDLYRLLLVDRNKAWLPKIEQLFDTVEVEFILVGALHLVGDDGVISSLRQRGYQVELF